MSQHPQISLELMRVRRDELSRHAAHETRPAIGRAARSRPAVRPRSGLASVLTALHARAHLRA
jgi:hypothetical protein